MSDALNALNRGDIDKTAEMFELHGNPEADLPRAEKAVVEAAIGFVDDFGLDGNSGERIGELEKAVEKLFLIRAAVETKNRIIQCERLRQTLPHFGLSKAAANHIVSEIKSENILAEVIGPSVTRVLNDENTYVRVDIDRHYWNFDRAGKLVERGVKDSATASTAA